MSKQGQKETNIKTLYNDLNKHGLNSEFEKAIKAANKILSVAPNEVKAQQCKLVSFIQLSKFQEALSFLNKSPDLKDFVFEKAYCEYRLNQPENALKTIDSVGAEELPPNLKELRAQVLYRLERFEECFDAYKDLVKNTHDDYDDERLTNMSAVAANLAIEGSQKEIPDFREDTYELSYNRACLIAGKKKFPEAEKKLRSSEKLCREYLEEDGATEEDIEDEVAIIKIQLAYCLQMQGKTKEAAAIYVDALKNKKNDAALIAVASNNMVAINKDQNMFDSKKKMRSAMSDACEHKLTLRQKKNIAFNNCLLAFYTNQADQCQQQCSKLIQKYPDLEFHTTLIRASQLSREKKYKEAIEGLEKYSKKHPQEDLSLKFAIVQLQLVNGNKKGAVEVLQSLGEAKYRPGVVSALVSLLLGMDNKQGASEVLKNAVEWYKKNKGNVGDLSDMWRQAADFHLRGGEAETAASSLEELFRTNPTDMKILAQLVIAYAQFNPAKAQEASRKLPTLETLTTATEIDHLEATNWMMSTKAVKKTAIKSDQSPGTSDSVQKVKKRRQKKRKGKLPKNYDPNVAPDPERWLPRYERTGYRKKRDRRVKEVMKGSQGTSSGAADQYDMTKAANLNKNNPSPAVYQEPTPGPRQQQRKGHQKKKKGRH
ncbi:signal recognition particle subunit SRP72 [Phlebotomus argentipes]|uniref:signal recognition particle subunit SRP72 n=1 Tax=Phlebotomus argentipes TaxID=94469 RepID=UPI0028938306|nr:signal recognition particle subunit SRP72 [Phlebotomus argentipes]